MSPFDMIREDLEEEVATGPLKPNDRVIAIYYDDDSEDYIQIPDQLEDQPSSAMNSSIPMHK